MNMNDKQKEIKKKEWKPRPHLWKKGQSGNPRGRPRRPEIEELRKALEVAKEKNKKSFLVHFVEKAYEDKDYAIALFKKILPNELFIDKEDRKIIIHFSEEVPRPVEEKIVDKTIEAEILKEEKEEEE